MKYRILKVGENIRENDQYYDGVGWNPTTNQSNVCNHPRSYRRPILKPSDAFIDEFQIKCNLK